MISEGILKLIELQGIMSELYPESPQDKLCEFAAHCPSCGIKLSPADLNDLRRQAATPNGFAPWWGREAFMGFPVQANDMVPPGDILLVERAGDPSKGPRMLWIRNIKTGEETDELQGRRLER